MLKIKNNKTFSLEINNIDLDYDYYIYNKSSDLDIVSFIITGNTIINNKFTVNSPININNVLTVVDDTKLKSNLYVDKNIYVDNINSLNDTLNIKGTNINIGDHNSIINIIGTATYIATIDTNIKDKLFTLNINESEEGPADIGFLCGLEILGTSGTGYIKTSKDATQFLIKPPTGIEQYIATLDLNKNLNMIETSNFYGPTNILSQLNISGTTIINNNISIITQLNINGDIYNQNNIRHFG